MVRPYPQVQAHGPPQGLPQQLPIQPGPPVTVSATPIHLPQVTGQPTALTEGQMKVNRTSLQQHMYGTNVNGGRHFECFLGFKAVLKSPIPSRLIAPAPALNQGHLPVPSKVPGHITVTLESSIAPTPSIPVATISSQQVTALLIGSAREEFQSSIGVANERLFCVPGSLQ